jgi:Tfp pilus assembly PilM family ATPase
MYRDWLRQPYRHKLEREPIGKITLFGGNPDLELLQESLASELHLPVRIASPLHSEIQEHDLDHLPPVHAKKLNRFSSAIGLALSGR